MSGSTRGIFKEKGGVQVREMTESSGIGVAVREPTAGRRPTIWRKLLLELTAKGPINHHYYNNLQVICSNQSNHR